ncbi:MAG: hypothetical protein U1F61_06670 [Opitutaceae bacterium]
MRFLVKARLKENQGEALRLAVEDQTLGRGSIAGDEYLHNMWQARVDADGIVKWVETCFCATPLDEERPY